MKSDFHLVAPRLFRSRHLNGLNAFSLIEVLVVLSIMSVLAVLTLSSFSTLGSVSLTSSGNQIVNAFAAARENSISKNAYTAVVIKSQGVGAYTAYCLLESVRQSDGSLTAWTAITPWHYLGHGVVFENGQSNDTFTSISANLPQPLPTAFSFQGQQIDLTLAAVAQCYQPDGTLSTQPSPPARMGLRLTQGTIDPNSGAFTYQGTWNSGKAVSYYDLIVVANTGVVKIERP